MLKLYEKLISLNKKYFTSREIARALEIKEQNRKVALYRLVQRKLLRRLRRNIYEINFSPSDIVEVANSLYYPSYLSFIYCLGKLGMLNQIAYEIEFATPNKTKRMEIRDRIVVFRQIKKELFFGYSLKDNIFIAEPEKALLDTLYIESKGLTTLNIEELNLSNLSKYKFLIMSKKFPLNIQKEAKILVQKMK